MERDSRRDRWYTAEEAREYGFVDAVVESLEELIPSRRPTIGLGTEQGSMR